MTKQVYMGYYKNDLLAISITKEVLKNYLQSHRGLTKREYTIQKEEIEESDLIIKYDDQCINEYHGYYIPNIDIDIIGIQGRDLDLEIYDTIQQLKKMILLSQDIKKIQKEEITHMIETVKALNSYLRNPKILEKLIQQDKLSNSILYCNIEDYLKEVQRYKEMREMKHAYDWQLYKDS